MLSLWTSDFKRKRISPFIAGMLVSWFCSRLPPDVLSYWLHVFISRLSVYHYYSSFSYIYSSESLFVLFLLSPLWSDKDALSWRTLRRKSSIGYAADRSYKEAISDLYWAAQTPTCYILIFVMQIFFYCMLK